MPNPRGERLATTISQLADTFPQWAEHTLAASKYRLTAKQLQVLEGLETMPTIGTMADSLQVTPAVVTVLAHRLTDRGYLRRIGDVLDARTVQLEITPAGRDARDDASEMLVQALADGLADLSAVERRTVSASLEILERLLEKVADRPERTVSR